MAAPITASRERHVTMVRILFAATLALTWWLGHHTERIGFSTPLSFHEVAEASGMAFRHESARFDPVLDPIDPQISAVGAGVSVVDVDGDGDLDVFATSSRHGTPNALFLNDGEGRFTDVADGAGLADLNRDGEGACQMAVFADYDGDGDQDVFVARWGRPLLLRNEGDLRFVDVTRQAGLERWMHASAAVWFDADRDGLLDLYVGGYFADDIDLWKLDDTRIMHDSFEYAVNGGHNVLYRNRGDGTFDDVTEAAGVDSTRWTMAVASADLDGNGWPDLYLANDYGPEELFLNQGGLRFELLLDAGLEEQSKSGMCVAFGNIENDARWCVYVTNISERGFQFQGNNLRLDYVAEHGRFYEIATGEVQDCGWAWGAQFGDLDLDGRQDLFVVNGYVSADPEREYWYDMAKLGGALGSVIQDAANWPAFDGKSMSGYQRSRVLLNAGTRHRDVAGLVGVDDRLDGRAVVLADLTGDGTLDAVVANQRGPLLFYRSEPIPHRHWIAFDLRGTTSNRGAIGAEVSILWAGGTQRQVVTAGLGFSSQAPRRLHFGLGLHDEIERVEVLWPSGIRQVVEHPTVDSLHALEEPR